MAENCGWINSSGIVFGGDCRNITAIDCLDITFDAKHNDKTFVRNSFLAPTDSVTATGSSPTSVDGTYGTFYCDDSGGDVIIEFDDPARLKDGRFTFLRTTAGGNDIIFTDFNGELLNGAALTQILIPTQWDKITITTDGTDWFIIM